MGPMAERTPTNDAAQKRTAALASTLYDRFARKPWLLAGVLVVVTFVAYIPALRAGFIWDDREYFAENPLMASVDGLIKIWSSLRDSRFVPLTLTSFWVERRLWGLAPPPYHAVNIGLHAVNAVLLWVLLRRLKVRGAWVAAGATKARSPLPHARSTSPERTTTATMGSGWVAGPCTTAPVVASKRLR